eukprot:3444354-Rhodomonas_salina.3
MQVFTVESCGVMPRCLWHAVLVHLTKKRHHAGCCVEPLLVSLTALEQRLHWPARVTHEPASFRNHYHAGIC